VTGGGCPRREELQRLVPQGCTVLDVRPLHGDGSARRFFRIVCEERTFVLCAGPDPAENRAYLRVAKHLQERGVRVPEVFAADDERGWILLEDLGDRSLFAVARAAATIEERLSLYEPVLDLLARMQVEGARGFDLSVGFAPAPYGAQLMVEQEGMYFAVEFAEGLLGLGIPAGFRRDVERLAEEGSRADATYFLHRDFQCRNVHLTEGGPAVIDFQGARPGPLAYDAAALILDPYAAHPERVRSTLFTRYLDRVKTVSEEQANQVVESWRALGAFRLLQALGAFAKLGGRFGKAGFLEHAAGAFTVLLEHLGEEGRASYPVLSTFVQTSREAWLRRLSDAR
jgi:aminoglycoside/choline kinase family phosphotransferase